MLVQTILTYVYQRIFVYQLVATLVTFTILRIGLFIRSRIRRYQLFKYYGIPGPEPNLIDGNLDRYMKFQAHFKLDEEYRSRYGKYFGVFIGDEPKLIVTDPELLRKIFFDNTSCLKERSVLFIDSPITHSLLFARYERWRIMRKVMSPAFSSYMVRGESSTQFIERSVKLMLDYIEEKTRLNIDKSAAVIDIHQLMKATALHLISSMAVLLPDVQVKEDDKNVKSLDAYLSSTERGIIIWAIKLPFLRRILSFLALHLEQNATMALIQRALSYNIDQNLRLLKANEKNIDQTLMINTLIRLHHEGRLTRSEVMGNAQAILFAGYETTSTTLSYIFWVLGKHTDIQTQLRKELMAHGVESKFLEQVINETMRLYPTIVSFTTRLVTETFEVDGLTLPQGTCVTFNNWLMQRDPDLWPEPEKFDPERFREDADIHPCAFAPFGLSDRRCIGYNLAYLEMKMIICDILMRYELLTISPDRLDLVSCANVLTKSSETIRINFQNL